MKTTQIQGSTVSEVPKLQMSQLAKASLSRVHYHLRKAQEEFDKLSNAEKDLCLEFHNENGSINHCLRWGEQAAEDLLRAQDAVPQEGQATVYFGYVNATQFERIEVDFDCDIHASEAEVDQAFLAALAQKVSFDYLAMGNT